MTRALTPASIGARMPANADTGPCLRIVPLPEPIDWDMTHGEFAARLADLRQAARNGADTSASIDALVEAHLGSRR